MNNVQLEDVESGLMHAAESVYTEYPDARHDEWPAIREALWEVSLDDFEDDRQITSNVDRRAKREATPSSSQSCDARRGRAKAGRLK
jgi:hypothetical protein